jgi:outer membrane protein
MKQVCKFFMCAGAVLMMGIPGKSQPAAAGTLTLQQAIDAGITNNLLVQQSGLQSQAGEINWKQARLNRLPNLNGSASSGIQQGRSIDPFTNAPITQNVTFSSYGLTSGVTLFSGLSLQNSVKQTALLYEASKMDWQQAKDNVTINIILAYLQVLSNEDQLVQSHNQEDLTSKQVERLEILNKDGAIVPSLLSDLKGQFASDQLTTINTQNALETAKITLCQLMNVPYDKNIKLERLNTESFTNKYEDTPDQVYQSALARFALVKAVDLRKRAAEKALLVAKGAFYPTLSLNGDAGTNYSDAARTDVFINTTDVTSTDYVVIGGTPTPVIRKQSNFSSNKISYGKQLNGNLSTSFSLNLRIPIFNWLQTRNKVKLAKLDLKNSDIVAKSTKTQLQQSIEQAYINMTSAWDSYKILLGQVNSFTESFNAADARFNAGVGSSVDYIIAKNFLDRANINLINAKYDALLRMKILDYYQGKKLW